MTKLLGKSNRNPLKYLDWKLVCFKAKSQSLERLKDKRTKLKKKTKFIATGYEICK